MQDDQKARLEYDVRLAALSQACHDLKGNAHYDAVLERAQKYSDFLRGDWVFSTVYRPHTLKDVVAELLRFDTKSIDNALQPFNLRLAAREEV